MAAPTSRPPVAAAQPMSGGTAPTTAPTHVLITDSCFSGVYMPAYSAMLAAPSAAVVMLVCGGTGAAVRVGGRVASDACTERDGMPQAELQLAGSTVASTPPPSAPFRPAARCREAGGGGKREGVAGAHAPRGQRAVHGALHEAIVHALIHLIEGVG